MGLTSNWVWHNVQTVPCGEFTALYLFYKVAQKYLVIVCVVVYSKMWLFEAGHMIMLTRIGNSDIDHIALHPKFMCRMHVKMLYGRTKIVSQTINYIHCDCQQFASLSFSLYFTLYSIFSKTCTVWPEITYTISQLYSERYKRLFSILHKLYIDKYNIYHMWFGSV